MDTQKLGKLVIMAVAIFGAAWLYAWSMGAEPALALRIAAGALAPWVLGKVTDADKSAPTMANLKAMLAKQPQEPPK